MPHSVRCGHPVLPQIVGGTADDRMHSPSPEAGLQIAGAVLSRLHGTFVCGPAEVVSRSALWMLARKSWGDNSRP